MGDPSGVRCGFGHAGDHRLGRNGGLLVLDGDADVARSFERSGRIGRLHPRYFATVGNATSVERAKRYGAEIAAKLVNEGVQAVVFTST